MVRKPSAAESRLIRALLERAPGWSTSTVEDAVSRLGVESMNDGCMGSLRLWPDGANGTAAAFGRRLAECQFIDEDGVTVIASLNIDSRDQLFELDVWKVDFSPLKRIPERFDVVKYG
jgi:hypothetical protein